MVNGDVDDDGDDDDDDDDDDINRHHAITVFLTMIVIAGTSSNCRVWGPGQPDGAPRLALGSSCKNHFFNQGWQNAQRAESREAKDRARKSKVRVANVVCQFGDHLCVQLRSNYDPTLLCTTWAASDLQRALDAMTLPFLSGGPRQSSSVSLAISGTEISVHSNDYNHTVQALQVHTLNPIDHQKQRATTPCISVHVCLKILQIKLKRNFNATELPPARTAARAPLQPDHVLIVNFAPSA